MESKIFGVLGLSILTLVLFMSLVSGAALAEWDLTSNGDATNIHTNVNVGDFTNGSGISAITFSTEGARATLWSEEALDANDYFQITLSPKIGYDLIISNINFGERKSSNGPDNYQVQWSKNSDFSLSTTLVTITIPGNEDERDGNITGLNIDVNDGETVYIRWLGYNAGSPAGTWRINDGTLNVEGTVATVTPEFNFCEYDDGVSENPGELKVSIKDITVTKGFGDDEEWLPFDEVEVEIEVENKGDNDVDDISLEWGIYNPNTGEWAIEIDEEDEFNLKDRDKEKFTITFTVDDSDFDLDLDELDEDYTLYVRATGEVDDTTNPKTCASESEDIQIIIESDFVILNDLKVLPETAQCGSEVQITADVWNIGDDEQDDVSIVISNKELGINKIIEIGDIDAFEDEKLDTLVSIPSDAEEKTYSLKFTVYDDDHDVYENDYDEEEAIFSVFLKVEGNCVSALPSVSVSADPDTAIQSGGKAGEELVLKVTVTNTGDSTTTYTLNAAEYTEWASAAGLSMTTPTLTAGQSADILVTFDVNKDADGIYLFNFEVLSENQLVLTQPINVEIEKSGWGITGRIIGDNPYIWGIGLLNIILIIVIVIVAVRLARK